MCSTCVLALLLHGDLTSSRKKTTHDIEKSTLVHLCSDKKPLQALTKSQEHCVKITLWTSSGLSEVVAITARENTCNHRYMTRNIYGVGRSTNLVAKLHVDI